MARRVCNKKAVLEAVQDSGGIMSTIARRLGVDWKTADNWVKRFDETKQALINEKETILDDAEGVILDRIKQGDDQSAKWYLSKIGKLRGYGDSLELEGGIQVVYADKRAEKL